jgi:hypothetical protein
MMSDINADDAEFGMSDHKTHNELRAEIASPRAELALLRSQIETKDAAFLQLCTTARQNAEEKARLLAVIERWQSASYIKLRAGEFTVGEMRSVRAVLGGLQAEARAALACRPQGERSET